MRFKAGSRRALVRIYEKYRRPLLKLALALLNDRNAAEDVVHDVFIKFAGAAQRLRSHGNLRSYLATAVANTARNMNRDTRNRPLQNCTKTGLDGLDEWMIQSEQMGLLNDALRQIPFEQREVIMLHLASGMKFREIAQVQDVTVNTAMSRYRYGLEKLRSLLNGEIEE